MKTLNRKWREGLKVAAGVLLFTALHAKAIDTEDQIVNGQIIGATATELVAAAQPNNCYCTETCNP